MNEILRFLVESEGHCCIYQMLVVTKGSSKTVGDRLGVAPQTIRYWRSKKKAGECRCENRPNCALDKTKKT